MANPNPFLSMIPSQSNHAIYPHVISAYFNVFVAANDLEVDATGLFAFVTGNMLEQHFPGTLSPYAPPNPPVANVPEGFDAQYVAADFPRFGVMADTVYTLGYLNNNIGLFQADHIPLLRLMLTPSVRDNYQRMFSELVMCHQVSKLDRDNIDNYFLSKDTSNIKARVVLKMLDGGSTIIPTIVSQANSAALIRSAPFLKYHTTASSTPTLVMKAYVDLGLLGPSVFTPAGIIAAQDAAASLHDLNLSLLIPSRDIAVAHAYLSAVEVLPNKWYQGQRAMMAQSPVAYRSWKVFFAKFSDLSSNIDTMNKQNYANILATKLPGSLVSDNLNPLIIADAAAKQAALNVMKGTMDAEKLAQIQTINPNAQSIPTISRSSNSEAYQVIARDD